MIPTFTMPQLQIRPGNLRSSPAIEAWVQRKLAGVVRRYGARMTAIEVHFEDVNGPKHGDTDFRCMMEARVNGRLPIAVHAKSGDLYAAIDAAAKKLDAALGRAIERSDTRARRKFRQERVKESDGHAPLADNGVAAPAEPAQAPASDGDRRKVIIAGYGPVGRALAEELVRQGVPFTVVDTNPETARKQEGLGVPALCGDITDPAVLRAAGLEDAAAIAITIPDGNEAVRACAAARGISPSVYIAVRTNFLSQGLGALRAGANSITVEEIATANGMAGEVARHIANADRPATPAEAG